MKRYHDSLPGGHSWHFKTLELIQHYYWWPEMTVFVKNYVAGCAICQQMKINTHPSSPGLIPIKGQKNAKFFSQVTCNFITDLSESDGFDSLVVVVDHGSTKRVISIPCNKTIDATLTAQNYIDHVYQHFGLPDSFLFDHGPQFSSQVFREMGVLSSDQWRNRKSQPGTRNLFLSLLLQQPQNVETAQLPHGVQPQSKGPLHHKTDPVLPHDRVRTKRYPLGIQ